MTKQLTTVHEYDGNIIRVSIAKPLVEIDVDFGHVDLPSLTRRNRLHPIDRNLAKMTSLATVDRDPKGIHLSSGHHAHLNIESSARQSREVLEFLGPPRSELLSTVHSSTYPPSTDPPVSFPLEEDSL